MALTPAEAGRCLAKLADDALAWYKINSERVLCKVIADEIGEDIVDGSVDSLIETFKNIIHNPMPAILKEILTACLKTDEPDGTTISKHVPIQRLTSQVMSTGDLATVTPDPLYTDVCAGLYGLLEENKNDFDAENQNKFIHQLIEKLCKPWAKFGAPVPQPDALAPFKLLITYDAATGIHLETCGEDASHVHIDFEKCEWRGTLTNSMARPLDLIEYARDQLQELVRL